MIIIKRGLRLKYKTGWVTDNSDKLFYLINKRNIARAAINGLGRIGRAAFKILFENNDLEPIAINYLVPPESLAYLLKYDSVYGRYDKEVNYTNNSLSVDVKIIQVFNQKDPGNLPWKELEIDIVFD